MCLQSRRFMAPEIADIRRWMQADVGIKRRMRMCACAQNVCICSCTYSSIRMWPQAWMNEQTYDLICFALCSSVNFSEPEAWQGPSKELRSLTWLKRHREREREKDGERSAERPSRLAHRTRDGLREARPHCKATPTSSRYDVPTAMAYRGTPPTSAGWPRCHPPMRTP